MRRVLVIVGIVMVVAAGGVIAYRQFGGRPAQAQRGDPAIAITAAIRVLERSEPYRLTAEQVKEILPLLKVLRDTDPNDVEASRALGEQIRAMFTPAQRVEIGRVREEARQRRQSTEPGRPGPARPGGGQGGTDRGASRAELRQRILSRLIERLESRL